MARHDQRHAGWTPGWRCKPCRDGEHRRCVDRLLALAATARGADPRERVCACRADAHLAIDAADAHAG